MLGFFTTMQLAFAGVGSLIWHWGTGIGLIVICLLCASFTTSIPIIGPYLVNTRRDFLWAAFCIAVFLCGMFVGVHDEKARCEAKSIVIERVVEKAVNKAKAPPVRGKKRTTDPWDNTEN